MKYNIIEIYNKELTNNNLKIIINKKISNIIKEIEYNYYNRTDNYK